MIGVPLEHPTTQDPPLSCVDMNPEQASHRQAIPMNTLHNPVLLRAPDIVSSVDVAEGFSTVFSPASRFFATRELPVPVNTKETSAITPLSMSHPASVDDDTPSYPVCNYLRILLGFTKSNYYVAFA